MKKGAAYGHAPFRTNLISAAVVGFENQNTFEKIT